VSINSILRRIVYQTNIYIIYKIVDYYSHLYFLSYYINEVKNKTKNIT